MLQKPVAKSGAAWLELLRDTYVLQLCEESEYMRPGKIQHYVKPGKPVLSSKYSRHALVIQLQLLFRVRAGGGIGKATPATSRQPAAAPFEIDSNSWLELLRELWRCCTGT